MRVGDGMKLRMVDDFFGREVQVRQCGCLEWRVNAAEDWVSCLFGVPWLCKCLFVLTFNAVNFSVFIRINSLLRLSILLHSYKS